MNNDNPALLETAEETSPCNYYYSIASTLACMPENNHNSNCQWKVPVADGKFEYLDLSAIKGTVLRADWPTVTSSTTRCARTSCTSSR